MTKHVGQRVSRQIYLDDGTWRIKGDSCLKSSPRKYGTIRRITGCVYPCTCGQVTCGQETIFVEWDDGTTGHYLRHGVDPEPETSGSLIGPQP